MKKLILCILTALCLTVPAMALETSDAAMEAYSNIEAAVAEEHGVDSTTTLANYPDNFAGAWLDSENYLVIGLTDMSADVQNYYIERSGNGDVIRFAEKAHSLRELLNIQNEIAQTYLETEDEGFFMEGALIDLETNTVKLVVYQGGEEAALAYYQAIYGDAISVESGQELMESPNGEEEEDVIRISIWVILLVLVVILAVLVLVIVLIVKLIHKSRKKKQEKKRQAELAAAEAARSAKKRK